MNIILKMKEMFTELQKRIDRYNKKFGPQGGFAKLQM